jgi:hypothetical protein
MKVGKTHCKIEIIQQKQTRYSLPSLDTAIPIKLLKSPGPKLKLKSMIWLKQMATKLFQSFSKQNWFAVDLFGNGMLMIITRKKNIDYTLKKTSFRNTKKWYK